MLTRFLFRVEPRVYSLASIKRLNENTTIAYNYLQQLARNSEILLKKSNETEAIIENV